MSTHLVVGLTGGIGSGKSVVAELFAKKDICIIDTDQLARDVVQPGQAALQKIAEKFGHDVIAADGSLDRIKLRSIIFADLEKRVWLEQLLHPLIRTEMKQQIDASASPYCIVVIPLLFETKPNPLIQRTLVVDATEEMQLSRAAERDKTSPENIQTILNTQINREKRLNLADDVIENHGSLSDLAQQVDRMHEFYLSLLQNK